MEEFFTLLFLCTPIDQTIQNIFYKIKFSFLCTPIDIVFFYFLIDFLLRPRLLASYSVLHTTFAVELGGALTESSDKTNNVNVL